MKELISRAEIFTAQMKARVRVKTDIQLGDTVTIGKTIKAKGSRTYDLFIGKYYRCVGFAPFTLQLENSDKQIVLTQKEVDKAVVRKYADHCWHIEKK